MNHPIKYLDGDNKTKLVPLFRTPMREKKILA